MDQSQRNRNVPRIVLGGVLVACAVVALPSSMMSVFNMREDAQRVVVPGESTLTFDLPGTYTIFHEYVSTIDGVRYEEERLPSDLSLRAVAGGAAIEIEPVSFRSRYSLSGEKGVSVYRFTLPEGGDYTLTARYRNPAIEGQTVLSIVPWHPNIVRTMLGITIIVALLVVGIVLIQQGVSRHPQTAPGELRDGGYTYRNRMPFTGNVELALHNVRSTLQAAGFQKVELSETALAAWGPGMHNNKQPPLCGATKIDIQIYDGSAHLNAELGGVRFMRNFIYFFPPGLAVGLGLLFGALATGGSMPPQAAFMPLLIVIPWLFIGPIMVRSIRSRTTEALDLLLEDMQQTE